MKPTPPRSASLLSPFGWLSMGAGLLLATAATAVWLHARPASPSVFYNRGYPAGVAAGTLLDQEPFTRTVPPGARGWRYIYTTKRGGQNVVASAVALLPDQVGVARPVVAWAHGTTGIAAGCAPSVLEKPFDNVPDVAAIVRAGWAYVGADYPGLGTSGGHRYLIGDDAAHAVLDAVRAARQLRDARLSDHVVVWGHSQGGNSALWSGMRAAEIAPDLRVSGIAAFAPASDLKALVAATRNGIFGKIVSAYLISAYAAAYGDVEIGAYVDAKTRLVIADIASRCVENFQTWFSAVETRLLPRDGIFLQDPATGPLGRRLEQNTPEDPIAAPVFIAQGEADDLVPPAIQKRYVATRCAAGQAIDFRIYPGLNHISLVASDSPLVPDLIAWTRDRFEGKPSQTTCAK